MKILFGILAALLANTAFGYVVTNIGVEHQGVLNYDILYAQAGEVMTVHQCDVGQAPSLSACKITKTLSSSQFDAALAMPAPFSSSDEPMIPLAIRQQYQALLGDATPHNLRLAADGESFEDSTVSLDLATPLLLTPALMP